MKSMLEQMLTEMIGLVEDSIKSIKDLQEDRAALKAQPIDLDSLTQDEKKYYNTITGLLDDQLTLSSDYLDKWYEHLQVRENFMEEIQPDLDNLLYNAAGDADKYIEDFYKAGKEAGFKEMDVASFFGESDKHALFSLQNYNFELIKNLTDDIQTGVRREVWEGLLKGESFLDVAKRIEELPIQPLKVGNRILTPEYRARMIARTEGIRAANQGAILSYKQYGVEKVDWIAYEGDEVTCDDCLDIMEGNPYPIDDIPEGGPPLHPNCYDDSTQVYTENGWKLFKDVEPSEKILSIDPDTKEIEFVNHVNKVEYNYQGDMVHFHNNWFDMMVTPDHQMYITRRREKDKVRYYQPMFESANKLSGEYYIQRTAQYSHNSPNNITIGNISFTPSDFAYFMGWWLSEGYIVTTRPPVIGIVQHNNELDNIYQRVKGMIPTNVYKTEDRVEFRHQDLYHYLEQFGKSHEKFIPFEILQLSSEDIVIFLECYLKGDGHIKKCSNDLVKNSEDKTFFTTSKRMAYGLSECILKCGGYPSLKVRNDKGKEATFKNGTYTINNDMCCVRWNRSHRTGSKNLHKDVVPYEGMVYCLELERNHILWVMRNNKTAFSGNCRCSLAPYNEPLDEAEDPDSYMNLVTGEEEKVMAI